MQTLDILLRPLAALYGAVASVRARLYARHWLETRRLARPVVSVGNLTLGGTGKTPFVAALARHLCDAGLRPAIVSRGYGRRSRGVVVVSDGFSVKVDRDQAGDEPWMLARELPGVAVVVGESRFEAGQVAEEMLGADVHLLDDGFQHLSLARTLDIVLLDAGAEPSSLRVVPAGRLREPLAALGRAHMVVLTRTHHGHPLDPLRSLVSTHAPGVPVYAASQRAIGWRGLDGAVKPVGSLSGKAALVLAGIGAPAQFLRDLDELGVERRGQLLYRDHHRYTAADIKRIKDERRRVGAEVVVVTTMKDQVRLDGLDLGDLAINALMIEAVLPEDASFLRLVDAAVGRSS